MVFAGVLPEHKYEIVKRLQVQKHICGITGDGMNDAPALEKANTGIAMADSADAARRASDQVLMQPGLSVIITAILTSHAIFQRVKNYTVNFIVANETCSRIKYTHMGGLKVQKNWLSFLNFVPDICRINHHTYGGKIH